MITSSPLTPDRDLDEVFYRDLVNNFSGVIYTTDVNGVIQFASPRVLDLTGYRADEVVGHNFSFLVDPASLPAVYAHYNSHIRSGTRETTLEFRTVTRDGSRKWVEQIAVLLEKDGRPAGFQCLVRDISEKIKLRHELETYEQRFEENRVLLQSILDNASSLIFVKDRAGRYLMANQRFFDTIGQSEAAVIGNTADRFCSKDLADRYAAIDERVLTTGESFTIEETLRTKDGLIHLLLTKFPLKDHTDEVLGVGGIATDITDRARYQQELITARVEAEDARRMEEQFLANMSHEIRTPINGIKGMTHLLRDTPLMPQQQEFVDIINRSVENLLVIINDILDLSKIKAGKLNIESIDFRLGDVLSNVRQLFAPRLDQKGLGFELSIGDGIPAWLQGDPHRLNQVLVNLVGNAIKFTDKGTIRVGVNLEARSGQTTMLGFFVSDEGIGISEKHLPHVFDSFSQAGPDIARRYGGTGLGLSICDRLVSLQGGSIEVESSEGIGTTFRFRLPFGNARTAAGDPEPAPTIGSYEGLLQGCHFLVVEDNLINQKVVDHVLQKAGARVWLAENGEEAVRLLETTRFDCIIMDLHMPVMDGYEATRHLRRALGLRTPVLAMTASAITSERVRCLEAGMDDYMSKPFEFQEFYQRVDRLLRERTGTNDKIN